MPSWVTDQILSSRDLDMETFLCPLHHSVMLRWFCQLMAKSRHLVMLWSEYTKEVTLELQILLYQLAHS